MMRWLRDFWYKHQVRATAQRVLGTAEATDEAKAWARTTEAALAERRAICAHCMNPYEPQPRPWEREFMVRSVLLIPDAEPMPMLCASCFERVLCSPNTQVTNIGTRNDGHVNLALRQLH